MFHSLIFAVTIEVTLAHLCLTPLVTIRIVNVAYFKHFQIIQWHAGNAGNICHMATFQEN